MTKALPIVAIVAAVAAALAIAVLVQGTLAMFLPVPVAIAGSIALIGQRTILGAVAGLLVLALAVLAALGLVGTVSTEDGGTDFGIGQGMGAVLAIGACLAVVVAAVAVRWEELEPRWLAIAGAALAVLAWAIVAMDPDRINEFRAPTLVAAGLALLSPAPMAMLLRGDTAHDEAPAPRRAPLEDAPLASAEAPLRKGGSTGAKPAAKARERGPRPPPQRRP